MELVPSLVVFGSAAVLFIVIGLAIRGAQRSSRAVAKRDKAWDATGIVLVRLDDAIEESDIELGLAGAMYGGTAPRTLAAARAKAADIRDAAFTDYQLALESTNKNISSIRDAHRVRDASHQALLRLEKAQATHQEWLKTNADAPSQVASARARLNTLQHNVGDQDALENDLAQRFADSEIAPVRDAIAIVTKSLAAAAKSVSRAEEFADQPGASIIADLADGERNLRAAEDASSAADQAYKAVIDASIAVRSEITGVRSDITKGLKRLAKVPADAAVATVAELDKALAALEAIEPRAQREPTAVIAELSRIRDRVNVALASARSARDRIEGARNALPGTIATARSAIARAEAIVATGTSAHARVRLASAHDALAASRTAEDAVAALDAVRRALRHAEDAEALALHARA